MHEDVSFSPVLPVPLHRILRPIRLCGKADAKARAWADETRRRGEAGELTDDSAYLARKLAEEKRKLE